MRNTILNTTLAALVLSSPLATTTEAFAKYKVKDNKHHFVQGPYENYPVMEMKYIGGKWTWVNQSGHFKTRLKVFYKANRKSRAYINLRKLGKIWETPAGYSTKKFEKLEHIGIGKTILTIYQNEAAALCGVFGGAQKIVRDMNLKSTMRVFNDAGSGHERSSHTFLIKVVCHEKGPSRVPSNGSNDQSSFKLKVKKLKLYTIPAQPKCGKPVKLIGEFHTNRPGTVNFTLHRGDGAKDTASVKTKKVSNGSVVKRWSRTYKFNETTNRKYRITVDGQHASTRWVNLKVRCDATNGLKN